MRALALCLALAAGPTDACRLALALGLDVSGSVTGREHRQQVAGLAAALRDPAVQAALLAVPDAPVALAVYEWSAASYQALIRDWALMEDAAAIERAASEIEAWGRRKAPEATGLGAAMLYGAALLARSPACDRLTLDLSGDGRSNSGPRPRAVRDNAELAEITVNALVIAPDAAEGDSLEAYFRAEVIRGPGAFTLRARGYDDYARAMREKLLKELETLAIGALTPTGDGPRPQ